MRDLAELQEQAIARGYTVDFGSRMTSEIVDKETLSIVEWTSLDAGTDPGDDSTFCLIESSSGSKGYLIVSDSSHVDPRKAALLNAATRDDF